VSRPKKPRVPLPARRRRLTPVVLAVAVMAVLLAVLLRGRAAPPVAQVAAIPPPAPPPPPSGQFVPNPQLSMPKAPQFPVGPSDKKAFNERKAAMTEEALKSLEDWIRYPLWSARLTENMRYQPPVPSHTLLKGGGDVEPSAEVWPEKLHYGLGERIRIFAVFRDQHGVTQPERLLARTIGGLRQRPELPLAFADQGDGTMVATLELPLEVARRNRGEWGVQVDAFIHGERRSPTNLFFLMATDAKVSGPYRVAIEDGNLVAYVGIEATAPSRQHLKGELWGPKGEPISYAWVRNDATPVGASTLKLVFYGKVLRDSGVDGPYELRNLLLTTFEDNNDRLETPAVDPAVRTPPWAHTQFTDRAINADNAVLTEKKRILTEELEQAKNGLYDPNDPLPARPTTASKDAPPPE
jgi:hypothetical protein